ncbi:DUF1801 domain-containing protein [Roseateles violae]|uniref:DUF1801 domain-containing protein n=1 Tax=Roseateles violae TaxID=3058042 RepID=A0ABT8DY04_9BURK|nr:DUF1801 domain-containing protein [Pelomonas sp. PFR6]MDN3922590.1 DUF1801 domain-containing protein [Pelomonas sp. PFR6]
MAKPKALGPADSTAAVDAFMQALAHPLKREIEALRAALLGAAPSIAEGIKWNAPSFRTGEYFATTHLREKRGLGLVLHLGAKPRELPAGGLAIDDPARLLKWLAPDRAMIVFADLAAIEANQAALQALVRQWITYV